MRATPVAPEEQYRLIMECRSSGLSDYQWCMERGIKPGTFYNWVKRLRENGCCEIPASARPSPSARQEIVRVEISGPAAETGSPDSIQKMPASLPPAAISAMELEMDGVLIRVPNGTDPFLLEKTIGFLRGRPC